MHKRKSFSLFLLGLGYLGVLMISTACDSSPTCWPGAPIVQVQATGGVVAVDSITDRRTVILLRNSDGKTLQQVNMNNVAQILATNGVVYLSSGQGTGTPAIVAIRADDGKQLWQFSTGIPTSYEPVAVQNGILYAFGNAVLYAIRASDGTLLWQFQPQKDSLRGSFALADGMAYVGADTLFAIHLSNGSLAWQFPFPKSVTLEDVHESFQVENGIIYALRDSTTLYAVRANDGQEIWKYQSPKGSLINGFKVANGMVYLPIASQILALEADNGKLGWLSAKVIAPIESLEVGTDAIYLQTPENIAAIQVKDGKQRWAFNYAMKGLVFDQEHGALYIGGGNLGGANVQVGALRLKDGSLLWQSPLAIQPQAVENGVVYLAEGRGDGCTKGTPPYLDLAAIQAGNGKVLWHKSLAVVSQYEGSPG